MSEIRVNSLGNETNTGGPELSGITTFSGQQYFIPPKGTTAQRPSGCPAGSIRFNTDTAHLEYWNGLVWLEFEASNVELGDHGISVALSAYGTGHRGIIAGGGDIPSMDGKIEYISISTLGNAQEFGDEGVDARTQMASCSSRTKGIFAGGYSPSPVNTISKIFFASIGNSTDFGDLNNSVFGPGAVSSQTRGIIGGGSPTSSSGGGINVMDFVTIAQDGAAVDFGDLTDGSFQAGECASSVRGIFALGRNAPSGGVINNIDFITITSTGNAQDFGDRTIKQVGSGGCSNSVRGLFGGGYNPSPNATTDTIDFITIASTGNAQDFSDLTSARHTMAAFASSTRGVWAGGRNLPDANNVTIDYVEIMTLGNALDFGDMTAHTNTKAACGCSNGHGGL